MDELLRDWFSEIRALGGELPSHVPPEDIEVTLKARRELVQGAVPAVRGQRRDARRSDDATPRPDARRARAGGVVQRHALTG